MKSILIIVRLTIGMLSIAGMFFVQSCCKYASVKANTCTEQCQLIPDPGPCKALIPRYYFDATDKTCKAFNWGGCDGVVPFETLEECVLCGCQ